MVSEWQTPAGRERWPVRGAMRTVRVTRVLDRERARHGGGAAVWRDG
jgi:hypothetical protein